MIPEQAWEVVPKDYPNIGEWAHRFAMEAKFSENERRSYLWAMYLLREFQRVSEQNNFPRYPRLPFYPHRIADISAGFIPLKDAAGTRDGIQTRENYPFTFGIVVGLHTNTAENIPPEFGPTSIESFPVFYEPRRFYPHTPPYPVGVSAACYARPRYSKRFFGPKWSDGIVTARHVFKNVGFNYGTSVPMSNGRAAQLVDVDTASTIDAAIIDCAPISASPLSLATTAPGTHVEIHASRGSFNADVLRVYEDQYYGNMMTHRAFIDTPGLSGDSGSLVARTQHGDAVGIYIGATAPSGGKGIVQCMRQVVQYFDIDLFL